MKNITNVTDFVLNRLFLGLKMAFLLITKIVYFASNKWSEKLLPRTKLFSSLIFLQEKQKQKKKTKKKNSEFSGDKPRKH